MKNKILYLLISLLLLSGNVFSQNITLSHQFPTGLWEANNSTLTATASSAITTSNLTVTVAYSGTNITTGDYTASTTITILVGQTTGTTNINATDDNIYEGDETLIATITGVSGGSGSETYSTSGVGMLLVDNESIELSRNNSSIAENGGSVTYTAAVSNSGTVENGDLTVNLSWNTGSATQTTDFTDFGNITITNGQPSGNVTLNSVSDSDLEGDETIEGKITSVSYTHTNGGFSTTAVQTTITDDEQASLVTPTDAATGQTLSPTLTWSDMSGADQYILEVYVDNSGSPGASVFSKTDISDNGSGNQSFTVSSPTTPILDNTKYHWRVAGKNTTASATSSYSNYNTFTTAQQTVSSPADGAAGVTITDESGSGAGFNGVTFSWSAVSGADQTNFHAGTSTGSYSITTGYNSILNNGGKVVYNAWAYNTKYYWVLDGANTRSVERTFNTQLDPDAINMDSEPSGNKVSTTGQSIQFDYNAAGGADNANVVVKLNGSAVTGGTFNNTGSLTDQSVSLPTLAYNTTYTVTIEYTNVNNSSDTHTYTSTSFKTQLDPNSINIDSQPAAAVAIDITGQSVQFDYNAVGGANDANIDVRLNGTDVSGSPINTSSDLTNQSVSLGTLSYNTTYALTIYVENGNDATDNFSETGNTFTTKLEPPTLTALSGSQNLNPTLSWNQISGADGYLVEVNTASNFGGTVIYSGTVSGGTNTSLDLGAATLSNPIEDNTTYHWRVTAKNSSNSNTSDASSASSFSTTQQTLSTPPTDGAYGVTLNGSQQVTLNWTAITGTNNYQLMYGTASNLSGATTSNTGTTNSATVALAYNTTYYWAVTAQNTTSGISSFSTMLQPISGLTTPTAGADRPITNSIGFTYDSGGNTSDANILIRYRVDGGSWVNLINATYSADVTFNESFTVAYNSDVDWEYSVINADNSSDSQTGSGSFRTLLANPLLVSPANGSSSGDRTPTLDWSLAQSRTSVNYDVIYTWQTTGTPVTVTDATSGNTTVYTFPSDLNLGRYTWDIRAKDGASSTNGTNTSKLSSNGTFQLDIVPQLDTPVRGLTGVSIEPFMKWDDGGVTDYIIDIATDNAFSNIVVTKNVSAANEEYQFVETDTGMPLENNTRYYWRVRYYDGTTYFDSETWHFTTIPSVEVSVGHPANASTVQISDTEFSWYISQSQGTLSYLLQIAQKDTEPTTTEWWALPAAQQIVSTTTKTNYSMLQGTKYWWRVVVYAADGSGGKYVVDYMTPSHVFTDGGVKTPLPTNPLNGNVLYTVTPTFGWTVLGPGTDLTYNIQVDVDQDSTNGNEIIYLKNQTGLTYTIPTGNLTAGGTYYWRVKSVYKQSTADADYSGSYSTDQMFTIAGGTSVTPVPSWPVGGATVYTNDPTFYWYLDGYGPGISDLKYQVRYSTSSTTSGGELTSGTNSPLDANIASASSDMFKSITGLSPGTTYYWQARVYDGTSFGSWSTVASFTTQGSGTLIVPTPSYPVGGLTIYTTAPTLYWYLGTVMSGLTYNIDIELSSSGLDGVIDFANVTALNQVVSGLTPGETYVWAVQSDNNGSTAGGTSNWSSSATFTVAGGTANSYPVANWPIGNPLVYSASPTLSWYLEGSSASMIGYIVKYSTTDQAGASGWGSFNPVSNDATGGQGTVAGATNTTWDIPVALTYGTTYYWAVTATDGSSETTYATGSFTVVGGDNQLTVVQTQPSDGSTFYDDTVTLYWWANGSTLGVTGYQVEYSRSDVFATGTDTHGAVTVTVPASTQGITTNITIANLVPGATYFWRITPYWGATPGSASVSSIWSFTVHTGTSPLQPLVGGPTNNLRVNSLSPVLSWFSQGDIENADYKVEVIEYNSNDWNNAITVEGLKNTDYKVEGLSTGTTYKWRVSAKDDGSYPIPPSYGVFSIPSVVSVEKDWDVIPTDFKVEQNYPNPFNPSTTIRYGIPSTGIVKIKVYDMLGQQIKVLVNEEKQAGTYEAVWNGTNSFGSKVASGTYIFRVVMGDKSITKKMLLLK